MILPELVLIAVKDPSAAPTTTISTPESNVSVVGLDALSPPTE